LWSEFKLNQEIRTLSEEQRSTNNASGFAWLIPPNRTMTVGFHQAEGCSVSAIEYTGFPGSIAPPARKRKAVCIADDAGRFVGVEDGNAPTYRAQRWSLPSEAKQFDAANDVFGASGYYVLAPGDRSLLAPVVGGDITGAGTLARLPDFLAQHPRAMSGNWVNFPGYALVTRPAPLGAGDAIRVGGISATVSSNANGAGVATKFTNAFSFRLKADAKFRLGVLVDAFAAGDYAPDYVSVYRDTDQTAVYSAPIRRDGVADLVTFDLEGAALTEFTVALHRQAPADGAVVGMSFITFDAR
jgi:hypothetical protein